MKSPFPGMDPYLEEHWRDVHHSFLTYASDELQPMLPGKLRARIGERAFVEPQGGENEPATEGYVEIIDIGSGNRVVTVLELLSGSNKFAGEGQEKYLQKQREYQRGGVSLVEIDLLRAGRRVLAVPRDLVPRTFRSTYQVCVTRGWRPREWQVYRVPLERPLPTIGVPLRETDQEVPLHLQSLIDRCYHNGRYDDIDYRREPSLALAPDDAAWAAELLKGQGKR